MRTIRALSATDRRILASELPKLRSVFAENAGALRGSTVKIVDAYGNSMNIKRATAAALIRALALADASKGLVLRSARGLSPRQAGEVLKMSRPTVMHYIQDGELKASKVNTHFRISPEAVEEFAAKRGERREALDRLAALSEQYDF